MRKNHLESENFKTMNNNQKGREKGKKADGTQEKGKNKISSEMKTKSQGTHGKICQPKFHEGR